MNRLTLILGVIAAVSLSGQSKEEMRQKYGEPTAEVFKVRPDINATVTRNASGRIVEILIAPRFTDALKSRATTLSSKAVEEVLRELVPDAVRGKGLSAGFINAICPENDCSGSEAVFEHVRFYYNGGRDGQVCYAVVTFKD
jgi:hypothetical protein